MKPEHYKGLFETPAETAAREQRNREDLERRLLCSSEKACAVADEIKRAEYSMTSGWWQDMPKPLRDALEAIEAATAKSPLRKAHL